MPAVDPVPSSPLCEFSLTNAEIPVGELRQRLDHPQAGGLVVFEGVVRNHHQGRAVRFLDYQGYAPLAQREGERILAAAATRWPLYAVLACHRLGHLEIGGAAVWIGTAAAHRAEAFAACAWIMDEIKVRLPVWKQETYADGTVEWSRGAVIRTSPPA